MMLIHQTVATAGHAALQGVVGGNAGDFTGPALILLAIVLFVATRDNRH